MPFASEELLHRALGISCVSQPSRGSVAALMQKSCPCAAGAKLPIAFRHPKSCRVEGLLPLIAVQTGHAFHSDFLLLDVSFRCKCTHTFSGIIPLSPAGSSVHLLSTLPCRAAPPKTHLGVPSPAVPQAPLCCVPQWDGIFPGPSSGSNSTLILQCFRPVW